MFRIFGNSTQDGTPTPDNPVEIVSVDNPTLNVGGGNLVENIAVSGELFGVTFTVNTDGTILANGTATSNINFKISRFIKELNLTDGVNYVLSGCPPNGLKSTYSIRLSRVSGFYSEIGNGISLIYKNEEFNNNNYFSIAISQGVVLNNLLFKPKLEIGFTVTPYEPYKSIKSINLPYTLRGIGDVKDEIVVYSDGTGKLIQRIKNIRLHTHGIGSYESQPNNIWVTQHDLIFTKDYRNVIRCNCLTTSENNTTLSYGEISGYCNSNVNKNWIYINVGLPQQETANYINNHNIQVDYVLQTPIETDLSSQEVYQILEVVRPYVPTTTIWNDKNADMEYGYRRLILKSTD